MTCTQQNKVSSLLSVTPQCQRLVCTVTDVVKANLNGECGLAADSDSSHRAGNL